MFKRYDLKKHPVKTLRDRAVDGKEFAFAVVRKVYFAHNGIFNAGDMGGFRRSTSGDGKQNERSKKEKIFHNSTSDIRSIPAISP